MFIVIQSATIEAKIQGCSGTVILVDINQKPDKMLGQTVVNQIIKGFTLSIDVYQTAGFQW